MSKTINKKFKKQNYPRHLILSFRYPCLKGENTLPKKGKHGAQY